MLLPSIKVTVVTAGADRGFCMASYLIHPDIISSLPCLERRDYLLCTLPLSSGDEKRQNPVREELGNLNLGGLVRVARTCGGLQDY